MTYLETLSYVELYWLGVVLALVWGGINLCSFRFIASHSDGGGLDAGTSFTFHPYLKRDESVVAEQGDFMQWYGTPPGEKVLRVAVKFIPGYVCGSVIVWVLFFLVPAVTWLLFPNDVHRSEQFDLDRCTKRISGMW